MRKSGIIYLILALLPINISLPDALAGPKVDKLIESGDFETAYDILLDDSDNRPSDELNLYLLGLTAPNGNRSSLFLKEYLQKFTNGPHAPAVRRQLLDYYQAAGLQITAGRLYSDFPGNLEIAPDGRVSAQDLYRAAVVNQQLGHFEEAVVYYRKAIDSKDGGLIEWCEIGLADCALLKGDYGAAEDGYKELIDKYPDSPSFPFSLIGLSETYRRMGDLDRSTTYYQLYSERYESSPGAEEIEAAILEKETETRGDDLPSMLNADYFVQVGVFAKKDNAKRCIRKFRNLGYRSRMDSFEQNGKTFYKALIGPYDSENSARREKTKLEKSQGEEYLIVLH